MFNASYCEVLTENLAPGMICGYGDPAIIRVENQHGIEAEYYLVVTSNDAPDSFHVLQSKDLVDGILRATFFQKDTSLCGHPTVRVSVITGRLKCIGWLVNTGCIL